MDLNVSRVVAAAPYRTDANYQQYVTLFSQASYVSLASALVTFTEQITAGQISSGSLTIPRIWAALALLRERGPGVEACALLRALLNDADWSELAIARIAFEELLRAIANLSDTTDEIKATTLQHAAIRIPASSTKITLARCLACALPRLVEAQIQPDLQELASSGLQIDVDDRFGRVTLLDAIIFFTKKAISLIECRGAFDAAYIHAAAAMGAQVHAPRQPAASERCAQTVQLLSICELLATHRFGVFPREQLPKPVRAALSEACTALRPLEALFNLTSAAGGLVRMAELDSALAKSASALGPISADSVRLAWTAHRLQDACSTVSRASCSDLGIHPEFARRAAASDALGALNVTVDDAGIVIRGEPCLSRLEEYRARCLELDELLRHSHRTPVIIEEARISTTAYFYPGNRVTPANSHTASVFESD